MKGRPRAMNIILLALLLMAACSDGAADAPASKDGSRVTVEPGEPYPFSEPAPPEEATPVDGIYRRTISVEQAGGPPVYCQRCAPWRLDAGEATLRLARGELSATFEPIKIEVNCRSETRDLECKHPPGFDVSAHYRVDGDRLEIFNDPNCIGMTGIYQWSVRDGALELYAVEDECPFVRLRQKYLTAAEWQVAG